MKTENWNGYNIRFIDVDGEWYAILKDICDALGLRTDGIAQRLDPDMLLKINVEFEPSSNGVRSRGNAAHRQMLVISEEGIYEALYASRKLEARKFRRWSASVMRRLRKTVGLEQYEVLQMTDPEVQNQIDNILDSLYFDADRGIWMKSVTVPGGDVEQVAVEEVIQKGSGIV